MLWLDIVLIAVLAFFVIGTLVSAGLYVMSRIRARGPGAWASEWEGRIQAEGYAGLQVEIHGDGDMLTLTWPRESPAESWLYLDTRHQLPRPEQADGFDSGVAAIDRFFAVRAATPAAVANLQANRRRLDIVAAYIEVWWSEHTSVRVSANRAEFSYRERRRGSLPPVPAKRLVTQLPQMAAFTKALLAAAWWAPPVVRSAGSGEGQGAYRDGGELPGAQWELEDPVGEPLAVEPVGPFETAQIVQGLHDGRLSWLSRVRRAGQGSQTWQTLMELDALQVVVPPPSKTTVGESTQSAVGIGARTRRWLATLAHRPTTHLFVMLAGFFAWPVLSMVIAETVMGQASAGWPRAAATIVSSEVVKTTSKSKSKNTSKNTYTYRAAIRYIYRAGGEERSGDRIQFGDDGSGEARARALVARYPASHKAQVYYAPEHPEIATLETGSPSLLLFGIIIMGIPGLLSLGLGVLLSYKRLRIRRRRGWICASMAGPAPR